ncbi:hypothetical protein [Antarctobacter heliothermus]|uniref:hypothetical protein n=1 Tax=Antarctobacter heliothermus TaxID=74033 RepID=UPI0020C81FAE|nr:hypothetical protein [Antarctobacter heliothermus]
MISAKVERDIRRSQPSGVQTAGWFVAKDHARVGGQRTGDGNPLLLASGKVGHAHVVQTLRLVLGAQ